MKAIAIVLVALFLGACATTQVPTTLGQSCTSKLTAEPNSDVQVEEGTIDKEAIRQAIRDNKRNFSKCYNEALKRMKKAEGKIEIQWDIEAKGAVTNAKVRLNHAGDDKFGQCTKTAIEKITFPEPPKGQVARVIFPFIFENTGELTK